MSTNNIDIESIYKEDIKKLEKLKEDLEAKIKINRKENIKNIKIRNLQVFKTTTKIAAPFLICTTFAIIGVASLGGGFPFYKDQTTKYKMHSMKYNSSGYVEMSDEYVSNQPNTLVNDLIVYTPWEKQNNEYIRYRKEYKLDNVVTYELMDAVLSENYSYFNDLKFKEEKQITNNLNKNLPNEYYFEANLNLIDNNDVIKIMESRTKNTAITFFELFCSFFLGGLIVKARNIDYLDYIKHINNQYYLKKVSLINQEEELKDIKRKIKSYKATGGSSCDK